jgi:hypothetical protein
MVLLLMHSLARFIIVLGQAQKRNGLAIVPILRVPAGEFSIDNRTDMTVFDDDVVECEFTVREDSPMVLPVQADIDVSAGWWTVGVQLRELPFIEVVFGTEGSAGRRTEFLSVDCWTAIHGTDEDALGRW